ncbi:MAG: PDDEXK nuclease domain-containing protein [Bacteroidota bacterium]|nr:PDDEXK nuclease domain-containing protein [Bacteroidota bacterium]
MAKKKIIEKKLESAVIKVNDSKLFSNIADLIQQSRQSIAIVVNSELAMLYWKIGNHIYAHILQNQRAEYGEQIVSILSDRLTEKYGKGWGVKHLRHCLRTAETFTNDQIVYAVRRQLTWTHIRTLAYIDDQLKREFYLELCALERWSTRQFNERIGSMLYERTAISKKPDETIRRDLKSLKEEQILSPDLIFRDPYFLDFLGLKDTYSERDLESAIIAELQSFLMEMGNDFAFIARQKRISIDNDDYYIDLLFYHRKLRSLVALDLKLDKFKAGYKGQMELYLRWLEKHEMAEGENSPVGLILCSDANKEHIELMRLEESNIKVATYLTALPPIKLLQKKLHEAIIIAKEKMGDVPGKI